MISEKTISSGIDNPATPYGAQIVGVAEEYALRGCRETSQNRGPCVDEISKKYSGKAVNEPWCAKFAYVVAQAAAYNVARTSTKLPKTAGARDMLERSRKAGIRVDTTPAVGSVFYRPSTAPGATGHVGIVKGYDEDYLYTIEGNTGPTDKSQGVWWAFYPVRDLQNFRFIHVEDQFGTETTPYGKAGEASFSSSAVILALVGLGTFLWSRK